MFFEDAGPKLHRHVVASELHHLGSAAKMQRMQGRLLQRRGGGSLGAKHQGPSRIFRGMIPSRKTRKAPSVDLPESIIPSAGTSGSRSLQRLFPDVSKSRGSFCLRVSGAVAPSAPASFGRSLP